MSDSGLIGLDGFPIQHSATDKGVWRKVGFQWTLGHEALRAQWPLAREIRVFMPTFIPLGVIQRWKSPNGYEQSFLRCVIGQSKHGYAFTSEIGQRDRINVAPPSDFPFPLPGPLIADRTLVWWPPGEEGRTPGKYVDFAMYLEAMRQSVHRRNHQDPDKAEAEDIAALVLEQKRLDESVQAEAVDRKKERRKERRRFRTPKVFVGAVQGTPAGDAPGAAKE